MDEVEINRRPNVARRFRASDVYIFLDMVFNGMRTRFPIQDPI